MVGQRKPATERQHDHPGKQRPACREGQQPGAERQWCSVKQQYRDSGPARPRNMTRYQPSGHGERRSGGEVQELDQAHRRISERLSELERLPVASKDDSLDGVRSFYQDLTDNDWTDADEQALNNLEGSTEAQIKVMLRDAFRRSRVHPIPSLATLISVATKGPGLPGLEAGALYSNPDAVPAAERERIANLLHRELAEAANEIASRLKLSDSTAEVVRKQLESIEGTVISELTPLV